MLAAGASFSKRGVELLQEARDEKPPAAIASSPAALAMPRYAIFLPRLSEAMLFDAVRRRLSADECFAATRPLLRYERHQALRVAESPLTRRQRFALPLSAAAAYII